MPCTFKPKLLHRLLVNIVRKESQTISHTFKTIPTLYRLLLDISIKETQNMPHTFKTIQIAIQEILLNMAISHNQNYTPYV